MHLLQQQETQLRLIYQVFLMEEEQRGGNISRSLEAGLWLLNHPSAPPMIVLMAIAALHLISDSLPDNDSRPLLGKIRRRAEAILARPGLDDYTRGGALLLLGNIYWSLKRKSQAKRCFAEAIQMNPTDDVPYVGMGMMLSQDNLSQGISYFSKAIELGTRLAPPYLGMAQYALDNQNYKECRRLAEQALSYAERPTMIASAQALIGLSIFREFGPTEEAIRHLREANKALPENEMIRRTSEEMERAYLETLSSTSSPARVSHRREFPTVRGIWPGGGAFQREMINQASLASQNDLSQHLMRQVQIPAR